jgi:hypothetical protein
MSQRRQLALRTSVSSTSVTAITPGAGCSITSAATVSTTGATGCFTFRATFLGAGLGLALATARFAALAALRALLRLADFALRSSQRWWRTKNIRIQSGVALSTAVRGVYFNFAGPMEDRSGCRSDTHRCRVPTRHLWGQGKAARLRAAPTALLFEQGVNTKSAKSNSQSA